MAQGIQLEIVTPKGVVLQQGVEEVIVPTVNGELGVLPGHLPLLAALHTGLLHYRVKGELLDVGVGGGFVEVVGDKALILTDRFIDKDGVKVLEVRERLKDVDKQLEAWQGDLSNPERLELIEEEQWLATQLELYGDPPVPKMLEASRRMNYADLIPEGADEGAEAGATDAGT